MNILLWVLQVLLGLFSMIGGVFTISNYEKIANVAALADMPKLAWVVYGGMQVLFGFAMLFPKAVPVAGVVLSLLSLLGLTLFTQYAGFPGMLWGVVPALLLAFVAYGRFSKKSSSGRKKKRS